MKVRPSTSCCRYPLSSRRRKTVRMVESFMGREEASASRQASEEEGPWVHRKSMTSCSTSPRFLGRMGFGRGVDGLVIGSVLNIVALQYVTVRARGCQERKRRKGEVVIRLWPRDSLCRAS